MSLTPVDERRRRARRNALLLLGVAILVYVAFIVMSIRKVHT